MKIHWSFYLILGIGVLFASYKIEPQKFRLFIWLGYVFLVVGIAKLGIWFINRKKESPVEAREIRSYAYQPQQQRAARHCPRCGNNLQGYENFCSKCGQRIR